MNSSMKKIGIICAGDREVAPFLPEIEDDTVIEKAMLRFHEGVFGGVNVVVLFSGVCKVNAAIAAQILIDTFQVDAIINAGTAGGIDSELKIFDTVVATEATYHDVAPGILTEFHPWMDSIYFKTDAKLLAIAKQVADTFTSDGRVLFGRMVTGEAFIADSGRERIIEKYHPLSVDMETASIAHVCYVNEIPFLAVRSITDTAEHSGEGNFSENCDKASGIAKDFVMEMLVML